MVLSHSPVRIRLPLLSKVRANTAFSAAMEPGWGVDCRLWKLQPEAQSQNFMVPSSPPVTSTPSSFSAIESMMELWPEMLRRNSPWGHFHTLMLSDAAEAKVLYLGWLTMVLIDFLWLVRVLIHLPIPISQNLMKESQLPVTTWGSLGWVITEPTVWLWPVSAWICLRTRMSHTRAELSRPPVINTLKSWWILRQQTPLRCPWQLRIALFIYRSQHFTDLSSPQEKRYGCFYENYRALIVFMCPVREIFSSPEARSQNLIVRSADPVAKKVLQGETATALTQPWCPAITRYSLQGGCHFGFTSFLIELARIVPSFVASTMVMSSLFEATSEVSA